jgi:hypothetical protein
MRHGSDRPRRTIHGVFADDPIATTDQAWDIAVRDGIQPTIDPGSGNWNYRVPFPNAGLQGGQVGDAAGNPVLDKVLISTEPNCNTVTTAFPE